jgi:hypothetical protein
MKIQAPPLISEGVEIEFSNEFLEVPKGSLEGYFVHVREVLDEDGAPGTLIFVPGVRPHHLGF